MRSSRKRAVDAFLRAFSGVDARSIGRGAVLSALLRRRAHFCLSKTSKPLTTHPFVSSVSHTTVRASSSSGRQSRVVRIVAKDQNSRPSLNDVAEFKTSQKIPARPPYKSPCSPSASKLDRALASEQEKTTPRREA